MTMKLAACFAALLGATGCAAETWLHRDADTGRLYINLPGGNVARYFPLEVTQSKLLIKTIPDKDATTITIDLRDTKYTTTNGQQSSVHFKENGGWIAWGTAADCRIGQRSKAEINLEGTPFSFAGVPLATQGNAKVQGGKAVGWEPRGGYTCAADLKSCTGDCGGHCGHCGWSGGNVGKNIPVSYAFVELQITDATAYKEALPAYTTVKNSPGCTQHGALVVAADECAHAWKELSGKTVKPEMGAWGNYPAGCFVSSGSKLFFNRNLKSGNTGSASYMNVCHIGYGTHTTTTTTTAKPTTTQQPTTNTVVKQIQGKMSELEQQLEDQIQSSLALTKSLTARVSTLEAENTDLKKHVANLVGPAKESDSTSTTTTVASVADIPVPKDLREDKPAILADDSGNMHIKGQEVYIHGALRSSTVDQLKAELDALAYKHKADVQALMWRLSQLEDRHEGI